MLDRTRHGSRLGLTEVSETRIDDSRINLNAICPYYTMFPLSFPYSILRDSGATGDQVLDPFCGRGTTNYASRVLGFASAGIDSSPVAAAVAAAKLANATPTTIARTAARILSEVEEPVDIPKGRFWELAFHADVLKMLCRFREALRSDCTSDSRKALRALLMGALHGPRPKVRSATYLSNQAPRTYAPKPGYAVRFWEERHLLPEPVDVLAVVKERAQRYYGTEQTRGNGTILCGDSRLPSTFDRIGRGQRFTWVITSPPYYGMRTYVPDQWLRLWFLGGPDDVTYSMEGQVRHGSPDLFRDELRQVWRNVREVCVPHARLVVRFGAINDRKVEPTLFITESLRLAGWKVTRTESAGTAAHGRRQALHFANANSQPLEEYDVWAKPAT